MRVSFQSAKMCWAMQAQVGAGQSADTRREWANAVLEALRTQSKMPGQASLPPPSPDKGGNATQNTDTPSSGAQNPSTSGSAGPHAQRGVFSITASACHYQMSRCY